MYILFRRQITLLPWGAGINMASVCCRASVSFAAFRPIGIKKPGIRVAAELG